MSGSGGIQTSVNTLQTPAVAGDWCDSNPRYSVDAGPFGLVAGSAGLIVGRFAWITNSPTLDANGTPAQASNFGYGAPQGFVHRENQALIVNFLADASLVIPAGYECTLTSAAGVWATNSGTTEAEYGDKAFAYLNTGLVAFAPAGTIFGGASATGSSIAAETFSVTGSIAPSGGGGQDQPSILTVTVVGSGTLYPGASISGTGIPANPAPQIVAQLSGTTGGVGTYELNTGEITAASTTVSGTYGLLTIGTATGTFAVGDQLTGTNVVAGTSITQNVTGSGSTGGTMVVNNNTVVNSTTITASTAVETAFYARSTGLPGEIVKISNQLTP
jgi:hypothetical protein